MSESWFHRMEDDVRHAASRFHHHGDTIGAVETQAPLPSGAPMALADTSAALATTSTSLRTTLENGASALREALDNHMTVLDTAIGDVAAVAQIADHPAMQAMERALPVVPAAILQGVTTMLEAVVAEHAKTAEQPAEQQAA